MVNEVSCITGVGTTHTNLLCHNGRSARPCVCETPVIFTVVAPQLSKAPSFVSSGRSHVYTLCKVICDIHHFFSVRDIDWKVLFWGMGRREGFSLTSTSLSELKIFGWGVWRWLLSCSWCIVQLMSDCWASPTKQQADQTKNVCWRCYLSISRFALIVVFWV